MRRKQVAGGAEASARERRWGQSSALLSVCPLWAPGLCLEGWAQPLLTMGIPLGPWTPVWSHHSLKPRSIRARLKNCCPTSTCPWQTMLLRTWWVACLGAVMGWGLPFPCSSHAPTSLGRGHGECCQDAGAGTGMWRSQHLLPLTGARCCDAFLQSLWHLRVPQDLVENHCAVGLLEN